MRNLILSSLCLLPMLSIAQEMPNLNPPKEMDVFKGMIGKWKGNMVWEEPGAPKMEITTTIEHTWEGQFVRSVNVMDFGGMKMTESMYFGWDPEKKKYKSWSFTNWAPTPRVEWGTFDAKGVSTWVSEPWDAGMGEKTESRTTITPEGTNKVNFLLEFKKDGKFGKVMGGTLTRV